MRRTLALAAAAGLLALAACHRKTGEAPRPPAGPGSGPAATAGVTAPPERTPGLWEQKVSTRGITQVTRICLDKAAERRFTWWGQQAGQGACGATSLTPRPGGGWSFASTCDMGQGGRTATKGEVTGDVARSYKVTGESSIAGAQAQEMNGTHAMTLEAHWTGPCPAAMKPGDVLLPGGVKINVMQIPAG